MVTALLVIVGQSILSAHSSISAWIGAATFLLAEKEVGAAIERMKPEQRAAVIMALLALTLIGLFLIVFAMLGGHWARRLARHRPRKKELDANHSFDETDAMLRQSLESVLPEAKSDDTMQFGKGASETKAGG
jgi:hypothetical protein